MPADRYTAVAIALHWLIAAAIVAMIFVGWWMTKAIDQPATAKAAYYTFQLHKSTGLTILALSLVRIAWRLGHKVPPLPAGMTGWEKFAARATHVLFYVLMLVMPLSGWLYASTGWSTPQNHAFNVPTIYYGLFQVPHIPGLAELPDPRRAAAADVFHTAHEKLAWAILALLALHVAAALKHHFVDRDAVLTHMLPFLKPRAAPISTGRQ
jgi:cytochrome b561